MDAFLAMRRFPRRRLLHNRAYGCMARAGHSQCSIHFHCDFLQTAKSGMTSLLLAINPRQQPLQPSEPSAFCSYAAIRGVMHQPLSRFSTCRGKCVDYIGTSHQKARQLGISRLTSSVRHV